MLSPWKYTRKPFKLWMLCLLAMLITNHAVAQWSAKTAENNLISSANCSGEKVSVSDLAGGIIVAWVQIELNGPTLRVQRIDSSGNAKWTDAGQVISMNIDAGIKPAMVADPMGGVILVWEEMDTLGYSKIVAQKINSSGIFQWSPNGIVLEYSSNNSLSSRFLKVISDGLGGCIVGWSLNSKIVLQRLNKFGQVQWNPTGVTASISNNGSYGLRLVPDGAQGVYVSWDEQDCSMGYCQTDLFMQKIDSSGNPKWGSMGISIGGDLQSEHIVDMIPDDSGGFIIAWYHFRYETLSYVQKVGADGTFKWDPYGIELPFDLSMWENSSSLQSDGSSGAFIFGHQYIGKVGNEHVDNVIVQKISAQGSFQWPNNGIVACSSTKNQIKPVLSLDGFGGVIVAWEEYTFSSGTSDIYAQRIDAMGTTKWAKEGLLVSNALNKQVDLLIVSSKPDAAILTWTDFRNNGTKNIYAQNVFNCGAIGKRSPAAPEMINGNRKVCQGSQLRYKVHGGNGVSSYIWKLPADWTGSSTTNTIDVTVGNESGVISVMSMSECGLSQALEAKVEVSIADAGTTTSRNTISANQAGAVYLWYNCDGFTLLNGETNQWFTAAKDGSYAVRITEGACVKMSPCVTITTLLVDTIQSAQEQITIVPNPFSSSTNLELSTAVDHASLLMYNSQGQLVLKSEQLSGKTISIERADLPTGIYFLRIIEDQRLIAYQKLVIVE